MLGFIKSLFSSRRVSETSPSPQSKELRQQDQNPEKLSDVEILYLALGFLLQEAKLKNDIEVRELIDILDRGFKNVESAAKELEQVLPENSLIWPPYEIEIAIRQEASYEKELGQIKSMSSSELLETLKIADLKEIYLRVVRAKPKAKLRKGELISELEKILPDDEKDSIQNTLIISLPDPNKVEYRRKLQSFVRRFNILRYGILRNQQRLSISSRRKYWQFKASVLAEAPPGCKEIDGITKKWDDDFWVSHPVPCHQFDCSCRIDSLSKRDLNRKGISVT